MAEDSNVVALNDSVLIPGAVPENVVEMLRDLLAQAERGEIVGLAVVSINPASDVATRWAYEGLAHGFILVGGVARLLYRLNRAQD